MRRNVLIAPRFLAKYIAFAFLAANAAAEEAPPVGAKAPNFSVSDIDGTRHDLSAYKGKIVVLEWMNPYCPYDEKHYVSGNMPSLQEKWDTDDIIWLMVNSYPEGTEGYISANVARYLLMTANATVDGFVQDTNAALARPYHATRVPYIAVIDRGGVLTYAGAVDDQPTAEPADNDAAINYADETLSALASDTAVSPSYAPPYGCVMPWSKEEQTEG